MLKNSPLLILMSSVCSEVGMRRLEESLRIRYEYCCIEQVLCRYFSRGMGNTAVNKHYSSSDAVLQ